MSSCNPVRSPFDMDVKLSDDTETRTQEDMDFMKTVDYRHTVGQLLYVSLHSRPDLCAAVAMVSRYVHNPGPKHWQAVKRILRYIKGTLDHGVILGGKEPITLQGYSDSDWANDIDSRRSRTGYTFFLGSGCISWHSKRQATVALSTTEAEYMALSSASQELLWILSFLREIGIEPKGPVIMNQDNKGCIDLTKNNKNHPKTKHIDIRHHFVKDLVDQGTIEMQYCPTKGMIADIMTKALASPRFLELKGLLRVHSHRTYQGTGAVGNALIEDEGCGSEGTDRV
jgi:hypothetical protein